VFLQTIRYYSQGYTVNKEYHNPHFHPYWFNLFNVLTLVNSLCSADEPKPLVFHSLADAGIKSGAKQF
jgi:hypothetical protein